MFLKLNEIQHKIYTSVNRRYYDVNTPIVKATTEIFVIVQKEKTL